MPEAPNAVPELASDPTSRKKFLRMAGGTGIAASFAVFVSAPALAAPDATAAEPQQSAQPQQSEQPQQSQKTAAQIAYDNEIVCQKEEVTGSRLGSHRVCMTRGEWMRSRMEDKAWVERMQRTGDAQSK